MFRLIITERAREQAVSVSFLQVRINYCENYFAIIFLSLNVWKDEEYNEVWIRGEKV
jgi:hypothetical protein